MFSFSEWVILLKCLFISRLPRYFDLRHPAWWDAFVANREYYINAHRASAKFQPSILPRASRTTIVSVYSPTMRQTFQLDRALAGCTALGKLGTMYLLDCSRPGNLEIYSWGNSRVWIFSRLTRRTFFLTVVAKRRPPSRLIVYKKAILLESISLPSLRVKRGQKGR